MGIQTESNLTASSISGGKLSEAVRPFRPAVLLRVDLPVKRTVLLKVDLPVKQASRSSRRMQDSDPHV